jgi:hypothetical protein
MRSTSATTPPRLHAPGPAHLAAPAIRADNPAYNPAHSLGDGAPCRLDVIASNMGTVTAR